jgi:hypothetical protein
MNVNGKILSVRNFYLKYFYMLNIFLNKVFSPGARKIKKVAHAHQGPAYMRPGRSQSFIHNIIDVYTRPGPQNKDQ